MIQEGIAGNITDEQTYTHIEVALKTLLNVKYERKGILYNTLCVSFNFVGFVWKMKEEAGAISSQFTLLRGPRS